MNTATKKAIEEYSSTATKIARLNKDIEALIPKSIRTKQAEIRELSKLLESKKAEIREELHSGDQISGSGYTFTAVPVTILNARKVLRRIGEDEFIKRATITQTSLKDILTDVEIGKCEDLKADEFRMIVKEVIK